MDAPRHPPATTPGNTAPAKAAAGNARPSNAAPATRSRPGTTRARRPPAVPRPDATTVYTDGACLGNPGPGGWAWAVPGGRYRSGHETHSTNQRMEITAALEAVRTLDGRLDVVSDSTYVVNCFRDRWYEGWMARGWRNAQKKPVANRDLWEQLIGLYLGDPARISFRWVKGHADDAMNNLVDRLAVEAATAQRGSEGLIEPL